MRVAIALMGSRGDIQPGLALGLELQARGHDVVVGVPQHLERLVSGCDLPSVAFDYDPAGFAEQSPVLKETLMQGMGLSTIRKAPELTRELRRFRSLVNQGIQTLVDLCKGSDLIIANQTTQTICSAIASQWSIPLTALHLHPFVPNSFFRAPNAATDLVLPERATRNTWRMYRLYRRLVLYPLLMRDGLRKSLGTRKVRTVLEDTRNLLEIQAYSSDLVPGIADELASHQPFVGPLRLPARSRAGAGESEDSHHGLVEWIESGPPPIFLGFGSYSRTKPESEFLALAEEISEHFGERVLVNMESPGVAEVSDKVRVVGPVAHDLIFPRCRAAVVHGGAGTLHEVLRAGIPVLVGWINVDQPVWGGLVSKAGLGASARLSSLGDAVVLKEKISLILSPRAAEKAQKFGESMRQKEDGAKLAADAVESRFSTALRAPSQEVSSN